MSRSWFWNQTSIGIEISKNAVHVVKLRRRGKKITFVAQASRPLPQPAREAEIMAHIEEAVQRVQKRRPWQQGLRVSLCLPRQKALLRTLQLPPLRGEALRAAVAMQLNQVLPFSVNSVDFAYARGQAPGELLVAVVKKEESQHLLSLIEGAGLKTQRLVLSSTALGLAGTFTDATASCLLISREGDNLSLVVWQQGREHWSRELELTSTRRLQEELSTSLAFLREQGITFQQVLVHGDLEPKELLGLVSCPVRSLALWPEPKTSINALGAALAAFAPSEAVPNLYSPPHPLREWRQWLVQNRSALGLTLFCGLLLMFWGGMRLELARQKARLAAVKGEVQTVSTQLTQGERLAQTLAQAEEEAALLRELKGNQDYLRFLSELSRIYPEGNYLTRLTLEEGYIRELAGLSPDAAALLTHLRRHQVGEKLLPQGQIVHEAGQEQFTFTGQLRQGGEADAD